MSDLPEPVARPTELEVGMLPYDDINYQVFAITVQFRGDDRWAVVHFGKCLGSDGEWAEGVKEYDRGDAWLDAHRFDLDTALALAKKAAPHVVVNGHTAVDAYRRTHPAP